MGTRTNTGRIALCGLLAALAIVLMILGQWSVYATYCAPVLAMFCMIPILYECGNRWALIWYVAVGVLSLIFTFSEPEAALLFVFLGYYPVIRKHLNRIRIFLIRLIVKLLIFNLSVLAAYALMIFLLRMDLLLQELQRSGKWLIAGTLLLANVCFLLVDRLLGKLEIYYVVKIRKKLRIH